MVPHADSSPPWATAGASARSHHEAIARIVSHFAWRNHYHRNYARFKLLTDPLYRAIFDQLKECSPLPLTDLGCGLGLNGMYLRQRGWPAAYRGIDFDQRKIGLGNEIMQRHYGPDCVIELGDLRDPRASTPGHVALLDVLQYFDREQQGRILDATVQNLAPDGRLLIRAALRKRGWRFRMNQCCDWFARGVFWMKSPPKHYSDRDEITAQLKERGLEGEFQPLWGRTPFSNWLGVFHFQAP